MNPNAEAELIARCRRGEAQAWDELFDRHYAASGRFVFQLASDFTREDVEEICQETFLSVIKSIDSFVGKSQFQTWLFRIAANKARDYRERQRAAKRGGGQTPISLQAEDPQNGLIIDPPSNSPAPGSLRRPRAGHTYPARRYAPAGNTRAASSALAISPPIFATIR